MGERNVVACRSCGAPIVWAHTLNGRMPVDAEPVENGNVELVNGMARVFSAPPLFHEGPLYLSHFVTCPDADTWRTR